MPAKERASLGNAENPAGRLEPSRPGFARLMGWMRSSAKEADQVFPVGSRNVIETVALEVSRPTQAQESSRRV
jgi:hypothetical protein